MDQLQLENRELRGMQERLARKEHRARDLKKKNAHLGEQHTALLEDYEGCQEQVSKRDFWAHLLLLLGVGSSANGRFKWPCL